MATTTALPTLSDLSLTFASSSTSSSSISSSTTSATSTSSIVNGGLNAASTTVSGQVVILTNGPTIAGAGIPVMVIPYTADAPFMQKSSLPQGTVFIAVGAVLAFLGACVLLWRGLIAWSINRSVRRSAQASSRGGPEKPSTWNSAGYAPVKDSFYKDVGASMSLDALNSAGKPLKPHFKDSETSKSRDATPPAGLFFSPTAQGPNSGSHSRQSSAFLPAGYYAAAGSSAAGGAASTTVGGAGLAPFARTHNNASPPVSPNLGPTRTGLRAPSRDGLGGRESSYGGHNSTLTVGQGPRRPGRTDSPAGERAPSAYLDDLFENHGNASRDRL